MRKSSPCSAWCGCEREKVRHAWLVGGDSGRKFAMRGQNAPNWAILGEQGEFCTGSGPAWFLLGEFCPAHAVRRSVLGEFCTGSGPARFLLGEFCPAVAPSVCPGAELPPPTGTAARPSYALRTLRRPPHRWLSVGALQFRMQFPDVCSPWLHEKPGISTVIFQNLKCHRSNCMRHL